MRICCVFFFQAEEGIRDWSVTGVQTCALPIFVYRDRWLSCRIIPPAMPASLPAWGFRRPRRGRSPASRYGARGVNSVPAFRIADVFDEDYLYFSQAVLTPERSDAETRLITRLAGIAQGTRVLDVGCGAGRIANRLAALGAQGIGVDVVGRFLEEARTDSARRRREVRYPRPALPP